MFAAGNIIVTDRSPDNPAALFGARFYEPVRHHCPLEPDAKHGDGVAFLPHPRRRCIFPRRADTGLERACCTFSNDPQSGAVLQTDQSFVMISDLPRRHFRPS